MRAAVSRTLFSFGTKDDEKKAIEEAEKYVKRYYNESDMLTTMVAPHSPYTCSTELLEECARIAVENQTIIIFIFRKQSVKYVILKHNMENVQ